MIALIGAGFTLQNFKRLYKSYDYHETHRDSLEATGTEIIGDLSFLDHCESLIFSLPPSAGALNLVKRIKFEKPAFLLSSIGVYQKISGVADEESSLAQTDRAQLIHAIEKEFLKFENAVVLRLGGLFNEQRHPIHSIIRRNVKVQANELINFVHITDVCEAIHILLQHQPKQQVYNLVDRNHPTRKHYYSQLTDHPLIFETNSELKFQVSSDRFMQEFKTSEGFLNRIS